MDATPPVLTPAEKHYAAVRRAQKKYYEKMKALRPADRRPPGRPKKAPPTPPASPQPVAEGV